QPPDARVPRREDQDGIAPLHRSRAFLLRGDLAAHHLTAAVEDDAFLQHQRGRRDIALDVRAHAQLDALAGHDIAVDVAVDDGGADVHVAVDFGALARQERSGRGYFPTELPVENQRAGEAEAAFEIGRAVENSRGVLIGSRAVTV